MAEDLVNVDLNSLNKPEFLKIAQQLQNAVKEKKKNTDKKLVKCLNDLERQNKDIYYRLNESGKCLNDLSQYT